MIRKIIKINEEDCNGCGLCADACQEGAIAIIDGKAKLMREDYCDGLGNCLPACPTGAITFEEREADAFDEAAVVAAQAQQLLGAETTPFVCPGSAPKAINHAVPDLPVAPVQATSELRSWPIQIKLVPVRAPYFDGANLLIAADCAAYANGEFHSRFMKGAITLIGCPKLDDIDYSEKLTAIIANNNIKSVTVVRMEVPCCGGIENAAITALKQSGKFIPWQVHTLSIEGEVLE